MADAQRRQIRKETTVISPLPLSFAALVRKAYSDGYACQGDVGLDVVRGRRWKTRWHLEQAERQFPTALADRS